MAQPPEKGRDIYPCTPGRVRALPRGLRAAVSVTRSTARRWAGDGSGYSLLPWSQSQALSSTPGLTLSGRDSFIYTGLPGWLSQSCMGYENYHRWSVCVPPNSNLGCNGVSRGSLREVTKQENALASPHTEVTALAVRLLSPGP